MTLRRFDFSIAQLKPFIWTITFARHLNDLGAHIMTLLSHLIGALKSPSQQMCVWKRMYSPCPRLSLRRYFTNSWKEGIRVNMSDRLFHLHDCQENYRCLICDSIEPLYRCHNVFGICCLLDQCSFTEDHIP